MNLLEIRTKLVDLSGRYDLVDNAPTSYVDKGANFFIQAGQRYLDLLIEFDKSNVEVSAGVIAGQTEILVEGFRTVERIRMITPEGGFYYLEFVGLRDFREGINVTNPRGRPSYYTLAPLGRAPSEGGEEEVFLGNKILLYPPSDAAYTVVLEGVGFSTPLLIDTDTSYWSVGHPDLLLLASLYKMEVFYRNTQGANDYLGSLRDAMQGVNFDMIQQTVANPLSLKDSW